MLTKYKSDLCKPYRDMDIHRITKNIFEATERNNTGADELRILTREIGCKLKYIESQYNERLVSLGRAESRVRARHKAETQILLELLLIVKRKILQIESS